MALTLEQVEYIRNETNASGAVHSPNYEFESTQAFGTSDDFLNIVNRSYTGETPDQIIYHGATIKGPRGWQNDDELFRALVAKTITAAARHVRAAR